MKTLHEKKHLGAKKKDDVKIKLGFILCKVKFKGCKLVKYEIYKY